MLWLPSPLLLFSAWSIRLAGGVTVGVWSNFEVQGGTARFFAVAAPTSVLEDVAEALSMKTDRSKRLLLLLWAVRRSDREHAVNFSVPLCSVAAPAGMLGKEEEQLPLLFLQSSTAGGLGVMQMTLVGVPS
jgi:hypothetical protein